MDQYIRPRGDDKAKQAVLSPIRIPMELKKKLKEKRIRVSEAVRDFLTKLVED